MFEETVADVSEETVAEANEGVLPVAVEEAVVAEAIERFFVMAEAAVAERGVADVAEAVVSVEEALDDILEMVLCDVVK